MADVNADGLIDIYVCRSAAKNPDSRKNLLFINNGDMTLQKKGKNMVWTIQAIPHKGLFLIMTMMGISISTF